MAYSLVSLAVSFGSLVVLALVPVSCGSVWRYGTSVGPTCIPGIDYLLELACRILSSVMTREDFTDITLLVVLLAIMVVGGIGSYQRSRSIDIKSNPTPTPEHVR